MNDKTRYGLRGVSADKNEVHQAIKHLDKGLFKNAFCKVLPDLVGNDPNFVNIMHADTAGTKTSLAYIYHAETGDNTVWSGIVQDAIVMNIDDLACVGCTTDIILSSTIGRNKQLISGEVIASLISATQSFIDRISVLGVRMTLAGGETADVGDIVRTLDVGITAFGRMPIDRVIENNIQPGQVIVGLASYGQASYESEYNGGMGSNGLTSARHDVFKNSYALAYPESFNPAIAKDLVYAGSRSLTETVAINGQDISLGKLVLSPTRTYTPIIHHVLNEGIRPDGMIHCSGGAQTKVMKFAQGVHIIKDQLLEIPPLFKIIEAESDTERREMYEVFNMGHRLEFYVDPEQAKDIIAISKSFEVDAQIVGRVEAADKTSLTIIDDQGCYRYGAVYPMGNAYR